jgi:hypothetical protein
VLAGVLGQVAEKKAEVEREKHQLELTLDVTRNKFLQLDMIIQVAACMYAHLHMYMYVYRVVCMEPPPGQGNLTPQLCKQSSSPCLGPVRPLE